MNKLCVELKERPRLPKWISMISRQKIKPNLTVKVRKELTGSFSGT